MKLKETHLLTIGLCISMFTWGLSWPAGKVISHYASPSEAAFLRFVITFFGLLCLLLFSKQSLLVRKEGFVTLLLAGTSMSLYSYLFFQGLAHGQPGAGGVLVTTLNPIVAYTFGVITQRKTLSVFEKAGLFTGFVAGCVLLKVWSEPGHVFSAGNLYFISASFTWAILSKFTSKSAQYGSSSSFSLWMYLICSVLMFFLIDTSHLQQTLHSPGIFWLNMLFSALITTTLATTYYFYATSKLGAEKASSFIFLVPSSAALSSWLFLQEHIAWNTILGGALGTLAVVLINRK